MTRIYAINMLSQIERKKRIQCFSETSKHYFEFIDAVVGKDINSEELRRLCSFSIDNIKRKLTPGEVGCYLSHLKAIHCFLETKDNYAVIAEDDIVFSSSFDRVLDELTFESKSSFDVLLLGYRNGYGSFWHSMNTGSQKCIRFVDCGYGAHGYLISRAGAEKILSLCSEPKWPFDYVTGGFALGDLRVYGLENKVIELDEYTSSLSSLESGRKKLGQVSTDVSAHSFIRRVWWFIKRLRPIAKYET